MTDADADVNAAHFDSAQDDVFGRIAARYDFLCDLFSLCLHRGWKRRMARRILGQRWQNMLDVAAGTGHISLRVIPGLQAGQSLVISDICKPMLDIARRRAGAAPPSVEFRILDAHDLASVASQSVDLYSISLGMKITDRHQVMREAWRVLKPGGTFICLEASEIPVPFIQRAYLAYMSVCMPIVGWAATGGDASAYEYLLKGVRAFPGAEEFAREVAAQGFVDVTFERMSAGIVAIHMARKPA
jgi:ubiquinone/menaquinone biosynthesis methyltransferase